MSFKNLINKISILLLLTIGQLALAQPIAFQSTESPPYWSAELPEGGLGGKILQLISKSAGVEYTIHFLPVKRFRQSDAPFIVGDPDILQSRKNFAIFPIGIFRLAFVSYKPKNKNLNFKNVKSLKGYTLGVVRGTLEDQEYFSKMGIKIEESDSEHSLIRKIKMGRIDFSILVKGTANFFIKQLYPNEISDFNLDEVPNSVRPYAIIIDLQDPTGPAIARRYLGVMKSTLQSKIYHDILEAHYGKGKIPADRTLQLNKFTDYYKSTLDGL